MTDTLTPAIQDYLEVILDLSRDNTQVRVTDIANRLNIAKSSVTQIINTLYDLNLVHKEKYGPINLTVQGEREAKKVKYKHILFSTFLTKVLKVNSEIAERDACLIEHAVSPQTVLALIDFLLAGDFIDTSLDLNIEEVKIMLSTSVLSSLSPGSKGKIKRIDAKGTLRRRIMEMGVVAGDEILVKGIAPMGDPIEVIIKDYNLSLRKNEASSILVEVF